MKINWNYPTSVWVGENRIKDLPEACKNLRISSPLFVTDKDLINLDMTKKIILEIKKKFNTLAIFQISQEILLEKMWKKEFWNLKKIIVMEL